jgi:hypothetical protein
MARKTCRARSETILAPLLVVLVVVAVLMAVVVAAPLALETTDCQFYPATP